jgi:hypothetical protein
MVVNYIPGQQAPPAIRALEHFRFRTGRGVIANVYVLTCQKHTRVQKIAKIHTFSEFKHVLDTFHR